MSTNRFGMKIFALGTLILSLVAFSAAALAAEFTADLIQKTPMGQFTGKVYVKGKNTRREMTMMGQKQVMISLGDKRVTFILMPQQNSYMEMRWRKKDEAMNVTSIEDLKKKGKVKYLGKEKVSGYTCKKYKYMPDDPSASPVMVWIANKLNYPIRMEFSSPQGNMSVIYKNIKEKKIPNSLFKVPADYQKIKMPFMPMGN